MEFGEFSQVFQVVRGGAFNGRFSSRLVHRTGKKIILKVFHQEVSGILFYFKERLKKLGLFYEEFKAKKVQLYVLKWIDDVVG